MSTYQSQMDASYEARTPEEVISFFQEACAKEQADVAENQQRYDAWPWRDGTGYPVREPADNHFYASNRVYGNVPAWLNYGLGLGYKRQNIKGEKLLAPQEGKFFRRTFRRALTTIVRRTIQEDEQETSKNIYESVLERDEQAFRSQRDYAVIEGSKVRQAHLNSFIKATEVLRQQLVDHPELEQTVYLPRNYLELGLLEEKHLHLGTQQQIQSERSLARNWDEVALEVARASPDNAYAQKLFGLMRQTRTGNYAVQRLDDYNIQPLFADFEAGESKTAEAGYYPGDKKIRIRRQKNDSLTVDQVEASKENQASFLVHETRHAWQHREFPELFDEKLSLVDRFVAMKLTETDAFAAQDVHIEERKHQTLLWGPPRSTPGEISGTVLEPMDDKYFYSQLGIEHYGTLTRDWSDYQTTFMSEFATKLSLGQHWGGYENDFHNAETITLIKSGDFDRQVAASRFLQPEFLKRFCVAPDGGSYLPADPAPMVGLITKWVSTLHQPNLAQIQAETRVIAVAEKRAELMSRDGVRVINNSKDPLDLSPSLDKIMETVLQHPNLASNKPIYVFMGENHTMPTHVAMSELLTQRLQQQGINVALGIERPHNIIPMEVSPEPSVDNRYEQRLLRSYTEWRAPLTHTSGLAWAANNNISMRPVDAAWLYNAQWRPNGELDPSDPATRAAMLKHAPELLKVPDAHQTEAEIKLRQGLGLRVRNHMILDQAAAHAKVSGAQVYVLPIGNAHVFGLKDGIAQSIPELHHDSLVHLAADKGMYAVPVFVATPDRGMETIPDDAHASFKKGVLVVDGLDTTRFVGEQPNEREFLQEIYNRTKQSKLNENISANSSGPDTAHRSQNAKVLPNALATVAAVADTKILGQEAVTATKTILDIPPPPESGERRAPIKQATVQSSGWNAVAEKANGKIGTAAIVVNLADAVVKGDGKEAAAVVGTAAALHLGMKGAAVLAGTKAVPVVGQVVGGVFAAKDAIESAQQGNIGRAAVSGTEATLYAVAAGASVATVADCWNPTVIAPAAVAVIAGGAALTITAGRTIYDSAGTIRGWFGQRPENGQLGSDPKQETGAEKPKVVPPSQQNPSEYSVRNDGKKGPPPRSVLQNVVPKKPEVSAPKQNPSAVPHKKPQHRKAVQQPVFHQIP